MEGGRVPTLMAKWNMSRLENTLFPCTAHSSCRGKAQMHSPQITYLHILLCGFVRRGWSSITRASNGGRWLGDPVGEGRNHY